MSYTINVNYSSGDSENSWLEDHDVGLVWKDKSLALKTLNAIKEQYHYNEKINKATSKEQVKIYLSEISKKEWCSEEAKNGNIYDFCYSISCLMDDGSYRNIRTNWLGYFESLNYAKIISFDIEEEEFVQF